MRKLPSVEEHKRWTNRIRQVTNKEPVDNLGVTKEDWQTFFVNGLLGGL